MSRKSKTTAIFTVRLSVPIGSSVAAAQMYVQLALRNYGQTLNTDSQYHAIQPDWFTVTLAKKETTYGVQQT